MTDQGLTRSELINTFGEDIARVLIDAGLGTLSALRRELTEEGGLQHITGIGPAREAEILDLLEGLMESDPEAETESVEIEEDYVSQEVYQFDTEYEVVEEFDNLRGQPAGYGPGDVVMNLPRELGLRLVKEGKIRKKPGGLEGFSNPRPVAVRDLQEKRERARKQRAGN